MIVDRSIVRKRSRFRRPPSPPKRRQSARREGAPISPAHQEEPTSLSAPARPHPARRARSGKPTVPLHQTPDSRARARQAGPKGRIEAEPNYGDDTTVSPAARHGLTAITKLTALVTSVA